MDCGDRFESRERTEPTRLLWAILFAGAVVRLRLYLANNSLPLDDTGFALDLIEVPFRHFLPFAEGVPQVDLRHFQSYPALFGILCKALVSAFGPSEYVLRLLPCAASLVALPVFLSVARSVLSGWALVLACLLFAFHPDLIDFAVIVKAYSLDVCMTLVVFLAALRLKARDWSVGIGEALAWACGGAVLIWLSNALILVVAAVGLAAFGLAGRAGNRAALVRLSGVGLVWGGSFLVLWFGRLAVLHQHAGIHSFWEGAFIPFPPLSAAEARQLLQMFFGFFRSPGGSTVVPGLAAFCAVLGAITLSRRSAHALLIFGAPLALTILVSIVELFPFGGRQILFLAPVIVLCIAAGLAAIRNHARETARVMTPLAVALLLVFPVLQSVKRIVSPHTWGVREALAYLAEQHRPGDVVYAYYGAAPGVRFYGPQTGVDSDRVILGRQSRKDWGGYEEDLEQVRGRGRVWVVMFHAAGFPPITEQDVFEYLLNRLGRQVRHVEQDGTHVYLYDMSVGNPPG